MPTIALLILCLLEYLIKFFSRERRLVTDSIITHGTTELFTPDFYMKRNAFSLQQWNKDGFREFQARPSSIVAYPQKINFHRGTPPIPPTPPKQKGYKRAERQNVDEILFVWPVQKRWKSFVDFWKIQRVRWKVSGARKREKRPRKNGVYIARARRRRWPGIISFTALRVVMSERIWKQKKEAIITVLRWCRAFSLSRAAAGGKSKIPELAIFLFI